MRRFFCLVVLLVLHAAGNGATIRVPGDYPTIQGAIDAAVNYDVVLVSPGTYIENLVINSKEITLKSELGALATVVDGGVPVNPDHAAVVEIVTADSTRVEGFTLANGKGVNVSGSHRGGGAFCTASSLVGISDCIIKDNIVTGLGGGVYCSDGVVSFNRCQISGNYAGTDGGGAAIYWYGEAHFHHCMIFENTAVARGGGAYCRFSTLGSFNNCTFHENIAATGGGLMTDFLANLTLINDIFWANAPQQIYVGDDKGASVVNIQYSDVQGGQSGAFVAPNASFTWGAGMIDADPLFYDPNVSDDYHITYLSPCREVGKIIGTQLIDFEGDWGYYGVGWDIGADEFHERLYHYHPVMAGLPALIFVVGTPSAPVTLALGAGIQDPPLTTAYGNFFLQFPLRRFQIGTIPANGILAITPTTPPFWQSGDIKPIQALVGPIGNPSSLLTNLDLLIVQ